MGLRDTVKDLENDWIDMAKDKIKSLIRDIEDTDKLDAGKL